MSKNGNIARRLVVIDGIMVEDSPWLINPASHVGNEYKTGNLTAVFKKGIPTDRAARTLVSFLAEAETNNWNPEISVRLANILKTLNKQDTGPNRETIRQHMRTWSGAVLKYAGMPEFTPVIETAQDGGKLRVRFSAAFIALSRRRKPPFVILDLSTYTSLSGAYAVRLYEILRKNLTFRSPEPDGVIRWYIRAEKLAEKFTEKTSFKEFLRNIRNGIREIESAACKSENLQYWTPVLQIENARTGWRNAILWFECEPRKAENADTGHTALPVGETPQEAPASKLARLIIEEIRKDDPSYPCGTRGAWRRAAEKLISTGRTPKTIWDTWGFARKQWKRGIAYYAGISASPATFARAFNKTLAEMSTPAKANRGGVKTPAEAPLKYGRGQSHLLDKVTGMLQRNEITLGSTAPATAKPEPPAPKAAPVCRTPEEVDREFNLNEIINTVKIRWPAYNCQGLTEQMKQAVACWVLDDGNTLPESKAEVKALAERLVAVSASDGKKQDKIEEEDRKEAETFEEPPQEEALKRPKPPLLERIRLLNKGAASPEDKLQ
jgi:hypothetical protein